jgi:hypothetical protein
MVYRVGGFMASQTGKDRAGWRHALVSGVLAMGLMSGFGVSTAFAQPAEPTNTPAPRNCTGADCTRAAEAAKAAAAGCEEGDKKCSDSVNAPKRVNVDQILMTINEQYRQGDGGGQLSILIDDAMKLRAQGFRPSPENALALQDALTHRPNQTPLVEALKATIQFQRKMQAQQQMSARQRGPVAGPVPVIPNGSVQAPAGPGTMTIPLG